jgi:PilZ domain-containing protein
MTERIIERRAHPRAKASLPVTIGAADRRIAARVRDLSRSGISFFAPTPFKEMTAVKVDLELPGAKPTQVRADGAVVRCLKMDGEYEVAIFFTAIGDGDRDAIGRLVEAKLKA